MFKNWVIPFHGSRNFLQFYLSKIHLSVGDSNYIQVWPLAMEDKRCQSVQDNCYHETCSFSSNVKQKLELNLIRWTCEWPISGARPHKLVQDMILNSILIVMGGPGEGQALQWKDVWKVSGWHSGIKKAPPTHGHSARISTIMLFKMLLRNCSSLPLFTQPLVLHRWRENL